MISTDDVKTLATLSRIDMTEAEVESFKQEIGSILNYVAQIQSAQAVQSTQTDQHNDAGFPRPHNVFRDDVVENVGGGYTEDLLNAAPARDGNFVQVKHMF